MNRVIVTGANGFIGAALVKELCSRGIEVYAIIKNIESSISMIKDLPNIHIVI